MLWRRRLQATLAALAWSGLLAPLATEARAQTPGPETTPESPTLASAQHLFYNARYDEAAAVLVEVRQATPDDLGVYELRTSALHFQIKRALGDAPNKGKALAQCAACSALLDDFGSDFRRGQQVARARLAAAPADLEALYFLGKLDLNFVWLYLGTLGRKTGWDQYWEARRSLDTVLKRDPQHVRARVARAWIDYIVDTRMPWGTGWVLGGGNKQKGLRAVREAAAQADAAFFVRAEAVFALWDMQVRERKMADAVVTAQTLARDFPGNREVGRFLEINDKH